MKVIVMVKATKSSEAGEMPSEQLLTEMGKYNEELVNAGIMQAGEGLHPSSKGVRVRFSGTNRMVMDGPFVETNELVAGFWIWKVKSMQEAIDWVKRCPNPMKEVSEIEIRPVFSAEDFGEALTPELIEQEASQRARMLGLEAPRYEMASEKIIAGLNASYTNETRQNIPNQWKAFAPHLGRVPGQVGKSSYGVCRKPQSDCRFDYLTGVEVKEVGQLPADFTHVHLPAQRYAVFSHTQHVSKLPETLETIWMKWLPDSGLRAAKSPCFERYTEEYNPQTMTGGTEVWIPLQS